MKKFLIGLLVSTAAMANITDNDAYLLNHKAGHVPFQVQLGTLLNKTAAQARVTWDFAVDGGAVGDITPAKTVVLPTNAIVSNVYAHVITAGTSAGGGTLALKSEGADDLMAATAVGSLTLDAMIMGVPDHATVADYKQMTADRTVKVTVASSAFTAGKIEWFISYALGQ